jgi:hypothetical protein
LSGKPVAGARGFARIGGGSNVGACGAPFFTTASPREMRRVLLWGPAGAPAPELSPQIAGQPQRPAAGPQGRDQDEIDILSEVAEAAGAEPVFG